MAKSPDLPRVHVTTAELAEIRRKIDAAAWAKANFEKLCATAAAPPADGDPAPTVHARQCALAFAVSREARFAERAAQDLASVRDLVAAFGGNTLRVASHTSFCVAALELVVDRMAARERKRTDSMLRRTAEAIWANDRGDSNWQVLHNTALLAVGLLLGEPQWVDRAIEHPRRGLLRHLKWCVRDDGLWWEGSTGYHMWTIHHLFETAEMARRAGRNFYDDPECRRKLKATLDAMLRSLMPDLTLPARNDAGLADHLRSAGPSFEIGYARFGEAAYGWAVQQGPRDSIDALVYGRDKVRARRPDATSVVMNDSGWAFLRHPGGAEYFGDRSLCAMLDCGPHGSWHGHPDSLSLDLFALGCPLLQDQGLSSGGYNPREHWEWYRATLGHNTVTIDGVPQGFSYGSDDALAETGTGGRFDVVHLGRDVQMVEARADNLYPGAACRRAVLTVGNEYVADFFLAEMPGEHVFDYALHGTGWLTLSQATEPARAELRPTPQQAPMRPADVIPWQNGQYMTGEVRFPLADPHAAYDHARDVFACRPAGTLKCTFHGGMWTDGSFLLGGPGLEVVLLPDGATQVFTCRTPRNLPNSRAATGPTLIVRRTGRRALFAAVMIPFSQPVADKRNWGYHALRSVDRFDEFRAVKDVAPIPVGGDAIGLQVHTRSGRDVILYTPRSSAAVECQAAKVRFEGKCCCVRFDRAGRLLGAEVIRARHLSVGGRKLHNSKQPESRFCAAGQKKR